MAVDVLVAGAGPAGALTALLLARQGHAVVLVDRARGGRGVGEHLISASRRLLGEHGLAGLLDGHERSAGRVSLWRGVRTEASSLTDAYGPGVYLDRQRFDGALRQAAVSEGVRYIEGWVRDVRSADGLFTASVARPIVARAVVDATGRAASVARSLGAVVLPDAMAIAWCRWQTDAHPDRRLWVQDTHDGWWYSAPLPRGERVVVWHRPDTGRVDATRFDAELNKADALAERCGGQWLEGPVGRPAGGQRLDRVSGPGWCAVGDAALAFDPISSQGLYTALYGASKVAQAMGAWLSTPSDDWSLAAWGEQVEALRRAYLQNHPSGSS